MIDPEWFGEMPRAYLYDAYSSRIGISGALTEPVLLEWQQRNVDHEGKRGED